MNDRSIGDPIGDALRQLPRYAPRAEAATRIRARSHLVLAERRPVVRRSGRRSVAVVVNGAFALVSLAYLAGAIAESLRLLDALQ
jgi:hypothetical protein